MLESVPASTPTQDHAYGFAANMLIKEQRVPEDVIEALVGQGMEQSTATYIVEDLQEQITKLKKEKARKDMLYGGLWLAGGTILTLSNIGFIFWGAIIFGGIQFFRGVANL